MQANIIFVLLPFIAVAVNPDRQVRSAREGEPIQMAVLSDGAVLKVSDPEPTVEKSDEKQDASEDKGIVNPPQETPDEKEEISENIAKARRMTGQKGKKKGTAVHPDDEAENLKPDSSEVEPKNDLVPKVETKAKQEQIEAHAREAKLHQEKAHTVAVRSSTQVKEQQAEASAKETKVHKEAAPAVASINKREVKAHESAKARPKLSEGVSLAQDEPVAAQSAENQEKPTQDSEKSWKEAFFFFASLVLIAVLAISVISIFYFRRDQSQKTDGPETVGLRSTVKAGGSGYQNDSSSTSDSGEKIAMLFDRVRQSLEDLSDKTAQQADVAGGQAQGSGGQI